MPSIIRRLFGWLTNPTVIEPDENEVATLCAMSLQNCTDLASLLESVGVHAEVPDVPYGYYASRVYVRGKDLPVARKVLSDFRQELQNRNASTRRLQ